VLLQRTANALVVDYGKIRAALDARLRVV